MSTIHTHGRTRGPFKVPLPPENNCALGQGDEFPKCVIAYLWRCGRSGCTAFHPTYEDAKSHFDATDRTK
jgi:hypothetical protein